MNEPLDLQTHFPGITDSQWQDLILEDLSWEPLEGINIQPYYRRGAYDHQHLFNHTECLTCVESQLDQILSAQQAGTASLSFLVNEPITLSEDMPVGELPLFFRGKALSYDFFQSLCDEAIHRGHTPSQLQGAIAFPEDVDHDLALRAAECTQLWTHEIDLYQWHDLGASLVEEIACAFAQLSDAMDELADHISPTHLYVRVPLGERLLLEIARLRALRIGLSQILKSYKAPINTLPIMGVPSLRYKSVIDPDTHLIRNTLQYVAAMIGGCNVIVSSDVDHQLMIQHVLRHEGKLGVTTDATAGSWMIEHLTDALAKAGWRLFQTIESKGGLQKARSWIETKIQITHDKRCRQIRTGDHTVVGGNDYLSKSIPEAIPEKKSLIAPLESIRLRANALQPTACLRVKGNKSPWLKRLIELCALKIDEHQPMMTVIKTSDGFIAKNSGNQQISFDDGAPLDITADRLLKLLEPHAT